MIGAFGAAVVTTLALVLAVAGGAKLRSPASAPVGLERFGGAVARSLSIGELVLAAVALVVPGRLSGFVLAALFAAFAVSHVRAWRSGGEDCGCFGEQGGAPASPRRAALLTSGSAGLAGAAGVAGVPSLASLAGSRPAAALLVVMAASVGAVCWRLAFVREPAAAAEPAAPATPTAAPDRLVTASALFLERRLSRRTALVRIAVAGSALCVAPLRYLLYPGTALAAISPGDCGGGSCTDGFTAFCCLINNGVNSCPSNTFPGGWWMCTDYAGGGLCGKQGVRYYVDCSARPGYEYPGGCQCANGSCENERVACNIFRYGQCNTQIGEVPPIVCRMVVCENPSTIHGLNCGSSVAVDDSVCGQDAPCLVPAAVELRGGGGV